MDCNSIKMQIIFEIVRVWVIVTVTSNPGFTKITDYKKLVSTVSLWY